MRNALPRITVGHFICVCAWAVASCGGAGGHGQAPAPAAANVASARTAAPPDGNDAPREPSAPAESDECRSSRVAILEDAEVSRQRPCTAPNDCAVIASPNHGGPTHAIVVHSADAIRLDVAARDHLGRCGAVVTENEAENENENEELPAVEAVCAAGLCAPRDALAAETEAAAAPAGLSAEELDRRVRALAAFGDRRIGPIGGGPIRPSEDVVLARRLVDEASPAQLDGLLGHPNAAIRAHVAREIIHHRPEELHLVRRVEHDHARVLVGSMDDVPPIRDTPMTIAELVRRSLAIAGLALASP